MAGMLEGKTALISGGARGIGRAAALLFAREGARVAVADLNGEGAKETVDLINKAGGQAISIKVEVTSPAEVGAMIARTVDAFGRLDCAFNNAGIAGDVFRPTADHSEENWDNVMNVNLKGVWLCMKYQIPEMLKHGHGAIVNNSSVYGLKPSTVGHVPYAVSKHGVVALSKTAANEYAKQGIRVNAVCPGWTHSEIVDGALEAFPELVERIKGWVPMERVAETVEVARVVLWLCSEDASYVTGQALAPDGGWLAR